MINTIREKNETKEQVLKRNLKYGNQTSIQDWVNADSWVFKPHVLKAMEEHAENESIAFANWLSSQEVNGRSIEKLWKSYNKEVNGK